VNQTSLVNTGILIKKTSLKTMERVCIIGSGNWGSAIARIVGHNTRKHNNFEENVRMWVFEEVIGGRNLTDIINEEHENVKYLPGIKLPENIIADPSLENAVTGATILIFVLPHQFLNRLIPNIVGKHATNARAISLIKGIHFDEGGLVLISDIIKEGLHMDVSVLMGANVANEVARDHFCEASIGTQNKVTGEIMKQLFHYNTFRIQVVYDPVGVELCGALKNVVAIGAGFCDGLGFGGNTKAAIIRLGLREMLKFSTKFYSGVKESTLLESCGVADLITTCYNGRNRKCAEAFVKTGKTWDELEDELLGGQMLQGTLTAKEVHKLLVADGSIKEFPFFEKVYEISYEGMKPEEIVNFYDEDLH
jgi:glycerol-3-phosphate dehydrogenase (NAD+)